MDSWLVNSYIKMATVKINGIGCSKNGSTFQLSVISADYDTVTADVTNVNVEARHVFKVSPNIPVPVHFKHDPATRQLKMFVGKDEYRFNGFGASGSDINYFCTASADPIVSVDINTEATAADAISSLDTLFAF
jgi:hypothetical protein